MPSSLDNIIVEGISYFGAADLIQFAFCSWGISSDIESEGLSNHLSVLADSLNKARSPIHPRVHKPSKLGENLISLAGVVEKEHKRLLARRSIIEKRKEDHERQILEKEMEEETKRLSIQKKTTDEERERLLKNKDLGSSRGSVEK